MLKLKHERFGGLILGWVVYDKEPYEPGNQIGELFRNPYGSGFALDLYNKSVLINGQRYAKLNDIRRHIRAINEKQIPLNK